MSASDSVFRKAQSIGADSYAFAGTRITNDSLIIKKIARFETTLSEQIRSEIKDNFLYTFFFAVFYVVLFVVSWKVVERLTGF